MRFSPLDQGPYMSIGTAPYSMKCLKMIQSSKLSFRLWPVWLDNIDELKWDSLLWLTTWTQASVARSLLPTRWVLANRRSNFLLTEPVVYVEYLTAMQNTRIRSTIQRFFSIYSNVCITWTGFSPHFLYWTCFLVFLVFNYLFG